MLLVVAAALGLASAAPDIAITIGARTQQPGELIVVTLAVAIVASLKFPPASEKAHGHPHEKTGSIFGTIPPDEQEEHK